MSFYSGDLETSLCQAEKLGQSAITTPSTVNHTHALAPQHAPVGTAARAGTGTAS